MTTKRIAVGGLWHETNSFAPATTTLEDFSRYQSVTGEDLLAAHRDAGTELGGAIRAGQELGVEIVPLSFSGAVPSGMVTKEAFDHILQTLLSRIAPGSLDAVVLALHGAMAVDGCDDPETEAVLAIRELVGNVPLAITLDLHGNPGSHLADVTDVIAGYDTYPHVDMADRGAEAMRLAWRMLSEGVKPLSCLRKLPLLTVPQMQDTRAEPLQGLVEQLHAVEENDDIWTASLLPGYPYCDTDRLGFSVYVAASRDPITPCRQLAEAVWDRRSDFVPRVLVDPAEALQRVGDGGLTVLADVADNVGGGSSGNGTVLLRLLEARGGRDGVIVMWDPIALEEIYRTTSPHVSVSVGDHDSDAMGGLVPVSGNVQRHGKVSYKRSGSYMCGQRVDMGRVAVLDSGTGKVVLTENRVMPFDDDHLRVLGIDPRSFRIIVAKSATAWKAAFGAYAKEAIWVDTPGCCSTDLGSLRYARRPRPIFPIEDAGFEQWQR